MNPDPQGRVRIEAGKLTISRISLLDSGMYQCVAQNEHGSIYASAELKVVGEHDAALVTHSRWKRRCTINVCAINRTKALPP